MSTESLPEPHRLVRYTNADSEPSNIYHDQEVGILMKKRT